MMIDWENAPAWARWHTEDGLGRTWWAKRPRRGDTAYYYEANDGVVPEHLWYDEEPRSEMKLTLRPLPGFPVKT